MKKKKNKFPVYEYGSPIYPYPQQSGLMDPRVLTDFDMMSKAMQTGQVPQMPVDNTTSSAINTQPSVQQTNSIGSTLAGVGRSAGKILNGAISMGIPLLNGLIPEQTTENYRPYQPYVYNPYSQGTGSTAIMRKGGNIKVSYDDAITPEQEAILNQHMPYTGQGNGYTLPEVTITPKRDTKKSVNFDPLYDVDGNLKAYSPVFNGFDYNSALQTFNDLPTEFGGVPVQTSPSLFRDINPGFTEGPNQADWLRATEPYVLPDQQYDYIDYDNMEDGGSIKIKPENKGKFTSWAKKRGMGVQEAADKVMANKEDYSTGVVKMANFARNFGGKKKKGDYGLQMSDYQPGQEYDLTPDQIQQLISAGYQIEY